jgi:amidase
MTRTVAENAAMLEVIAGSDWRDAQWVRADPDAGDYTAAAGLGINGLRIGVITECMQLAACSAGILSAFGGAQRTLESLGAEVVPVSVPLWTHAPAIWFAEVTYGLTAMAHSSGQGSGHLGRMDANLMTAAERSNRLEGTSFPPFPLGPLAMPLVFEHLRESCFGTPFARAHNLRLELRRQLDAILKDVDLLITPTTPTGPFKLTDQAPISLDRRLAALRAGFARAMSTTCPVNLTGHPALTVPSGPGDNELPAGLQIIGRRFDEHTLYRAAFAFEATSSDFAQSTTRE